MRQQRQVYVAKVTVGRHLAAAKRGRDARRLLQAQHAAARRVQAAWAEFVRWQLVQLRGLARVMMQAWCRGSLARRR